MFTRWLNPLRPYFLAIKIAAFVLYSSTLFGAGFFLCYKIGQEAATNQALDKSKENANTSKELGELQDEIGADLERNLQKARELADDLESRTPALLNPGVCLSREWLRELAKTRSRTR